MEEAKDGDGKGCCLSQPKKSAAEGDVEGLSVCFFTFVLNAEWKRVGGFQAWRERLLNG